MEDHLLACRQFLKESHKVTRFANEQALFLKITYNHTTNVLSRFHRKHPRYTKITW
jgi:hypothetical protein